MRSLRLAAAAATLGLALVTLPARAGEYQTFTASLSADQETSPGPQGATGTAVVRIDQMAGQLCYDLTWSPEVGQPNAAHIHRGPAGQNGPIVVLLDQNRPTGNCLQVAGPILADIASDPGNHYVNIHNDQYLNGAVRGQLQKSG